MTKQLFDAVKVGDLEKVKNLVSFGADIRSQDDWVVILASGNGDIKMVKYLVSLGADIRSGNDCAVQIAFYNGYIEVVKYLLSIGADISKMSPEHQKYILFCQKMEEKKKERAQKKIYYWWIQICYDPETNVGKRMLEKSWVEFDKVQKKN